MKVTDILKKLGINLEDEIDMTSKTTSNEISKSKKDKEIGDENNNNKDNEELTNIEEDKKMAFKAPKVDKNGYYDLSEVEDEDFKSFLKDRNRARREELEARKNEDDKRSISDAINKYASEKVKFNDGWSLEDALKLGDFSKVLNNDDMNTEIENAFTNLKTAKAGMFVADKKTTGTSPMVEGFNPVKAESNSAMTEQELINFAYGQNE